MVKCVDAKCRRCGKWSYFICGSDYLCEHCKRQANELELIMLSKLTSAVNDDE